MALLECGHLEPNWPALKALGSIVKCIWCDTCDDWKKISRKATDEEIISENSDTLF